MSLPLETYAVTITAFGHTTTRRYRAKSKGEAVTKAMDDIGFNTKVVKLITAGSS